MFKLKGFADYEIRFPHIDELKICAKGNQTSCLMRDFVPGDDVVLKAGKNKITLCIKRQNNKNDRNYCSESDRGSTFIFTEQWYVRFAVGLYEIRSDSSGEWETRGDAEFVFYTDDNNKWKCDEDSAWRL